MAVNPLIAFRGSEAEWRGRDFSPKPSGFRARGNPPDSLRLHVNSSTITMPPSTPTETFLHAKQLLQGFGCPSKRKCFAMSKIFGFAFHKEKVQVRLMEQWVIFFIYFFWLCSSLRFLFLFFLFCFFLGPGPHSKYRPHRPHPYKPAFYLCTYTPGPS